MTIDDKIRDEKLQYDINREIAKISALSSGKIDKYEHLTSKEILPSNQRQIIGKAFEKQTKIVKDQGEKQIKAIGDNKQLDNKHLGNNELLLSKEREIRLNKIDELFLKTGYGHLKFTVSRTGLETDISELKDPAAFFDNIKDIVWCQTMMFKYSI